MAPKTAVKDMLLFTIRIAIGGLFILSGVEKIFQLPSFIDTVEQFNALPSALVLPFSALLPPVELVAGILLAAGVMVQIGSFAILFMLVCMLAAIYPLLLGGPVIENCNCFGGLFDGAVDYKLFIRDIVLFALTYLVFIQRTHRLTIQEAMERISKIRGKG
jgi:hypothetical protein